MTTQTLEREPSMVAPPLAATTLPAVAGVAPLRDIATEHHGAVAIRRELAPAVKVYPPKIAKAILAIMRAVQPLGKAGRNDFHKYNFLKMDDVIEATAPLCAEHGLIIIQSEKTRALFDNDDAVEVTYYFSLFDEDANPWPDLYEQTGVCSARNSKGGFDDKSVNKCHTAARKYFVKGLFQIRTREDTEDADSQEDRGRRSNGNGRRAERREQPLRGNDEPPVPPPPPPPPEPKPEPPETVNEARTAPPSPFDDVVAFAAFIGTKFSACADMDALNETWETYIAPHYDRMFPPDQSQMSDMYGARQREIEDVEE